MSYFKISHHCPWLFRDDNDDPPIDAAELAAALERDGRGGVTFAFDRNLEPREAHEAKATLASRRGTGALAGLVPLDRRFWPR